MLIKLTDQITNQLINEINISLSIIARRHGLNGLALKSVRWTPASFKASIDAKLSNTESPALKDTFLLLSRRIGFKVSILGKKMYAKAGELYTVVDINPRRSKYPIIGQDSSGKKMCFIKSIKFTDGTDINTQPINQHT